MAGRGMDDEPGGLVDHDDVVILIHDIERDVFTTDIGIFGSRHADDVCQPRFNRRAELAYGLIGGDVAIANERLKASAADAIELRCKPAIDALTGILGPRDDLDAARYFVVGRHVPTRKKILSDDQP